MNGFPCRCKKCGARKTLAMRPSWYEVEPACLCGGLYRIDTYRKTKEHKRTNCHCDGYKWSINNGPHRRGSLNCNYYAGPSDPASLER